MIMHRSRRLHRRISFLAISLAIVATACGGDSGDPAESTAPPAAGSAAEVYSLNCARCHGVELEGGFGPALGAESRAGDLDDAELTGIITEGRNTMPGWGDKLSPEQIADLVTFVRE
jgi:cytochrome c551